MIVADTSVLVSVLFTEQGADSFLRLLNDEHTAISAGTMIEASIVAHKAFGPRGVERLNNLIQGIGAEIVPTDSMQVALAQEAFDRFGKGRGQEPAALNFGDCFAYALAKALDAPLLFKGDDFAKTDVKRVSP